MAAKVVTGRLPRISSLPRNASMDKGKPAAAACMERDNWQSEDPPSKVYRRKSVTRRGEQPPSIARFPPANMNETFVLKRGTRLAIRKSSSEDGRASPEPVDSITGYPSQIPVWDTGEYHHPIDDGGTNNHLNPPIFTVQPNLSSMTHHHHHHQHQHLQFREDQLTGSGRLKSKSMENLTMSGYTSNHGNAGLGGMGLEEGDDQIELSYLRKAVVEGTLDETSNRQATKPPNHPPTTSRPPRQPNRVSHGRGNGGRDADRLPYINNPGSLLSGSTAPVTNLTTQDVFAHSFNRTHFELRKYKETLAQCGAKV